METKQENIRKMILKLGTDMIAASEQLTELDSKIGDGDMGITVTLGFRAVKAAIGEDDFANMKDMLIACADAIAESAPSTFGTLLAAMFREAGRVLDGMEHIGATEFANVLKAAADIVQKRGKAKLGDKTLLDALIPAAAAAEKAAGKEYPLVKCIEDALDAAKIGAKSTVSMRASAGRAAYLGEQTVGVKDPGALGIQIILQSVKDYVLSS